MARMVVNKERVRGDTRQKKKRHLQFGDALHRESNLAILLEVVDYLAQRGVKVEFIHTHNNNQTTRDWEQL